MSRKEQEKKPDNRLSLTLNVLEYSGVLAAWNPDEDYDTNICCDVETFEDCLACDNAAYQVLEEPFLAIYD